MCSEYSATCPACTVQGTVLAWVPHPPPAPSPRARNMCPSTPYLLLSRALPNPLVRDSQLFRRTGKGGLSNKEIGLQIAKMAQEEADHDGLNPFVELGYSPFWAAGLYEMACNNHRAVSYQNGHPNLTSYSPEYDHLMFNDAEHAEKLLEVPPTGCAWVPQRPLVLQERAPYPGQPHPDTLKLEAKPEYFAYQFESALALYYILNVSF